MEGARAKFLGMIYATIIRSIENKDFRKFTHISKKKVLKDNGEKGDT